MELSVRYAGMCHVCRYSYSYGMDKLGLLTYGAGNTFALNLLHYCLFVITWNASLILTSEGNLGRRDPF